VVQLPGQSTSHTFVTARAIIRLPRLSGSFDGALNFIEHVGF
jgi:hypothetical protein